MRRTNLLQLLAVVALASLGFLTAQAAAQAPSGNGQIDQYTETIPGAGGNEPTGGGGHNGGNGSNDEPVLTPEQSEGLEAQGADGVGVANLTQATAPPGADSRESGSGSGASNGSSSGDPGSSDAGSSSSSGGLGGTFDAVSGSASDDGLGLALPLILAAVAVAGVAFALRRRAGRTA